MEQIQHRKAKGHDAEVSVAGLHGQLHLLGVAGEEEAQDVPAEGQHSSGDDEADGQGRGQRGGHALADPGQISRAQILARVGEHGVAEGDRRQLQEAEELVGSGVEGMGFAIPINTVNEMINDIESGESLSRPYLGVQLVDLTNTFALQYYYNIKISSDVEFGAVLSLVEEGKPANKAGLQVGDVIIEIGGEKVDDVSHFKYKLYKHKVGDKITVKYYRNNKLLETTIELTQSTKSE